MQFHRLPACVCKQGWGFGCWYGSRESCSSWQSRLQFVVSFAVCCLAFAGYLSQLNNLTLESRRRENSRRKIHMPSKR